MLDKQFTNNLNIYLSYGSFYVKMEGITSLKERGSIYARIKGYKELDCWHTVVLFYFCQHRDHSHYSGGSIWDDASRNRSIVTVFLHYYWARMFRASFFGHGRPILDGQSGLWWGIFLTLVATASAQGMPLHVLGGSLAIGVIISGVITILIGLLGIGPYIAKLFNPGVMGVFMLLLGITLIQIFLKGMLGIPFGQAAETATINLPVAGL